MKAQSRRYSQTGGTEHWARDRAHRPRRDLHPPEVGKLTRVGYEEVLAAIVRGDHKARLKPPANRYRLVKGSDALAWFDTLPEA